MYLIVLLLFLILAVFSYYYNRSFVDPSFITSGLWFIILAVYNFVPHDLYPISDKFYVAITLWTVPFCLCALYFSRVSFRVSGCLLAEEANPVFYKRLLPLVLIADVVLVLVLMKLSGNYSDQGIAAGVRNAFISHEDEIPGYIRFLMYFTAVGVTMIVAYLFREGKQSWKYWLLIVMQVVVLLCLGNKSGFASLAFAILFLFYYYGKLTLKRFLIFFTLMITLMFFVALARGDASESMTLINYLQIYTLSPIPAFDMILNGDLPIEYGTPGVATFESFFKLFEAMGFNVGATPHETSSWWVNVPLPTNVFTHLYTFYLDFGYWGIFIFAIFFGCSWGILYNLMKRNVQLFVVIYAIFFYTLFLTFFADYVFTFLSLTIQYIVIAHLLFLRFKFSAHG